MKTRVFAAALLLSATCCADTGNHGLSWNTAYNYSITYPNPGYAYPRMSIEMDIFQDSAFNWKYVYSRGPKASIITEGKSRLNTRQVEKFREFIQEYEMKIDIPYKWVQITGRESGWGASIALSSSIEEARTALKNISRDHTQQTRKELPISVFLNEIVFTSDGSQ